MAAGEGLDGRGSSQWSTGQELTWRKAVGWWSLPSSSRDSQAATTLVPGCRSGHCEAEGHGERSSMMLLGPGLERELPSMDVVRQKMPRWGPTDEQGLRWWSRGWRTCWGCSAEAQCCPPAVAVAVLMYGMGTGRVRRFCSAEAGSKRKVWASCSCWRSTSMCFASPEPCLSLLCFSLISGMTLCILV